MVWGLVSLGLISGIATLVLFDWTLSNIRAERESLASQERQMLQTSAQLKLLLDDGRESVRTLLDETTEISVGDQKATFKVPQYCRIDGGTC